MPYNRRVKSRFKQSISQVDELLEVHQQLQTGPARSKSDHLLRASLTMTVSALDTLVHELIINAIMFELKESKSVFKTNRITIDISVALESSIENRLRLIESSLRRQYSKRSFQSSRQIEEILATIGITKIWTKLSCLLGQSAEDIKTRLDLIVRRRNLIVHEGDLDQLHNPYEIERKHIETSCEFCKSLTYGIIEEFTKMVDAG